MTQLGQHLFEPSAVTTSFQADDYCATESGIKCSYVVTLMAQLEAMNLAICQVAVTDCLLTSMKINCDIYCHRAPPLLITNPTGSVNNSRSEVPVSSHQINTGQHRFKTASQPASEPLLIYPACANLCSSAAVVDADLTSPVFRISLSLL